MLGDIRKVEHIYIACGYTDLRRGIDGLVQIVQNQFSLDPCSNSLFLFCGRRRDRIKALLWEGDGFILLYKRVETGCFQWPRTKSGDAEPELDGLVLLAAYSTADLTDSGLWVYATYGSEDGVLNREKIRSRPHEPPTGHHRNCH